MSSLSSRSHGVLMAAGETGIKRHGGGAMRGLLVAFMAMGILLGLAPSALAEETVCKGTIGQKTLDNVKVPQGAKCVLDGTKVKGTIKVNRNAVLDAIDVYVVGNVQGEEAKNVIVRAGSFVGGSVQVVQGSKGRVVNSKINGDILYDDQGGFLGVRNARVGGNVQAFQNTGGVEIKNNVIDGNLQCKENNPKPTGGGNKVGGNKEDQCKNL
jgi:hypothetical protein